MSRKNMASRKIIIQALVDFADERQKVNPWQLVEEAEAFYKSVKVVGLNNTVVVFGRTKDNPDGYECEGWETSIYVRAFVGHIMRLMYRWSDLQGGRLEAHLGLQVPIAEVLNGSGVFKTSGADLACTNVSEMIDAWTKN